ncbi:MAG: hypothetical protein CBB71_22670 [Rhodopirellula sp. TMED11]|nr:MAG: hypothetical protein CBB71_22670 [Rhodopirellula sp. TMED11]
MTTMAYPSNVTAPLMSLPTLRLAVIVLVSLGCLLGTACAQSETLTETKQTVRKQLSDDEAQSLIDALASGSFDQREQAVETLLQADYSVTKALREAMRASGDAEQTQRIERVLQSLSKRDIQSRIQNFLSGKSDDLDNWPVFKDNFGDSPRSRLAYVDLVRQTPEIIQAIGGQPFQLALAINHRAQRINANRNQLLTMPTRAETLAMLLPVTQDNFPGGAQYDSQMVYVLSFSDVADRLMTDPDLGDGFRKLVTQWIGQSDAIVRSPALTMAARWNLDNALPLARKTLGNATSLSALTRGMQIIAIKGDNDDLRRLRPYLHDASVIVQRFNAGDTRGNVQLRDLAAATIAKRCSVPIVEIGFAQPAEHDELGIVVQELVVPLADLPEPGKIKDADPPATEQPATEPANDTPPGAPKPIAVPRPIPNRVQPPNAVPQAVPRPMIPNPGIPQPALPRDSRYPPQFNRNAVRRAASRALICQRAGELVAERLKDDPVPAKSPPAR